MSDIAKWVLLALGGVTIITLILLLPFVDGINVSALTENLSKILSIASEHLIVARRLLNNFFTPTGRVILSSVIYYIFGKWFLTIGIKIISAAYHFIFRG